MRTGLSLFLWAAVFGITIATVYYCSSHDWTGTILLGIMACASIFAAGYMFFAEREARLLGDRKEATIRDGKGERVGIFTVESPWPPSVALGGCIVAIGLATMFGLLVVAGLLIIVYGIYRMIKESA